MMFILIYGVVILGITNGYILLEEELLIILASIFWVDTGGKFIKKLLINELVHKSSILKKKYRWFFRRKWVFDDIVIRTYYIRIMKFYRLRRESWQFVEQELLESYLLYILENNVVLAKYDINLQLYTIGITILKELVSERFEILSDILMDNHLYPMAYTTSQYISEDLLNLNDKVILTV